MVVSEFTIDTDTTYENYGLSPNHYNDTKSKRTKINLVSLLFFLCKSYDIDKSRDLGEYIQSIYLLKNLFKYPHSHLTMLV